MPHFEVVAFTADRWDDFANLCRQMGPNRSCWCAWWWEAPGEARTEPRQATMRRAVEEGPPPGLLAYAAEIPAGWVAFGPRAGYPRLQHSPDARSEADPTEVFAVPCFFVAEPFRGQGLNRVLLDAAVAAAEARGARAVDGIPVDVRAKARTASASYTGRLEPFLEAGFVEVARHRRNGRVLVRREVSAP